MLVSQLSPSKPATQLHVYELMPSRQVAPFKQGLPAHSSMLTSQLSPEYPGGQSQVYEATPSIQTPSFLQGPATCNPRPCRPLLLAKGLADGFGAGATTCGKSSTQSSMLISQSFPSKPSAHTHSYSLILSRHVPPFWQGFGRHSSTLVWQLAPINPGIHSQVYSSTPSIHVPPFSQGSAAQSSMLTPQFGPDHPAAQTQEYSSIPSTHVPPFWQGFRLGRGINRRPSATFDPGRAHSSMLISQLSPSYPAAQSHL
jgi:hypothetical protein